MGNLNPFGGSSSNVSIPTNAAANIATDLNSGGSGGIGSDFVASGGNTSSSSPFDFGSFNDFVNMLSGGGGGAAPIANAQAPVPQGAADPTAAAGGTQSDINPGQGPQQNQQQQQAPPAQQDQHPATATDELRQLLDKLLGKPTGPTGLVPIPPLTPTGPQSPMQTSPNVLRALLSPQSADARTSPNAPTQPSRDITVQPKARPVPPYEPSQTGPPAPPQTVQQGPEGGPPDPAPAPVPLPGPGGAAMPQPAPAGPQQAEPRQMSRLMQDITGISQGNPAALADLALALYGVGAPLAIAAGARGGRPSIRPGGHPGVDYASGYAEAQDMLHPDDRAQGLRDALFDKNGQPAPHGAFNSAGVFVTSPDKTPISNQIPGVTPKIADDYWRQGAIRRGMDPDIASKVLGAESNYGQNNINKRDVNAYPDYGPAQLNMAPGALGDQFLKQTGQDPRNFAQNWKQQMDFALDHIAKEGWTDLYPGTSKKLGLSRWSGINRPASPVSSLSGTDPKASFLTSAVS